MFSRAQVEKLLILNGVEPTAPDEEIRAVLVQARWHEEDVNSALSVLKENTTTHKTHVDTVHKIFRSDDRLQADTINAVLGIDVDFSDADIALRRKQAKNGMSFSFVLTVAFVALIVSMACLFSMMWLMKVGLFHQTVV